MDRAHCRVNSAGPLVRHDASLTIAKIRLLNLALEDMVAAVLGALACGVQTRIAFVNADCINIAARDGNYLTCLEQFDWVCADGIGMKLAGRVLGRPIRDNVNGTDFFPVLCAALEASGHSLYLLGARPGVAERTAQWVRANYPRVRIAGWESGYFEAAREPDVIAAIRAAGPAVLLVAMGAPLQEKWLTAHLAACGATVGIGVGGLFDFYSGRIARAPRWLRALGGEWAYRLMQEPGRMWRRYLLGNFTFLARILVEKIKLGNGPGEK